MDAPVAYFITFTTYGTWLHGRDTGSVDRDHDVYGLPTLSPDPVREKYSRSLMKQAEYELDELRRDVVLTTIQEVAHHRGWKLWAVHVRTNHVHIIVAAAGAPEKIMNDFKAWCSRRLREACHEPRDRNRWTVHGSTRYSWADDVLADKIAYIVEEQGVPMAMFDGRIAISEPGA